MTSKPVKTATKTKRPAKSKRIHNRRVKQVTRKTGVAPT